LLSYLSPCPPSLNKGRRDVGKRVGKPLPKISSPSPFKKRGIKGESPEGERG